MVNAFLENILLYTCFLGPKASGLFLGIGNTRVSHQSPEDKIPCIAFWVASLYTNDIESRKAIGDGFNYREEVGV